MASLAIAVSCGGSVEQDVLAPEGTSSGTGDAGSTDAGSSSDAQSSGDTGTPPLPGDCTPEKEKNDGRNGANPLAPSVCGVIDPASEVDVLTFQLKPTSTSLKFQFDGQVSLRVEVAGTSTELTPTNSPKVPFVKGVPYFVTVKALDSNAKPQWKVTVVEK